MAPSRRQLLRSGIAAAAFGVAGCSSGGTDQSAETEAAETETAGATTATPTATATQTQSQQQQQQSTDCGSTVEVSGTITEDTTWDCEVRMTDDVTVTNGATLTVYGAVVKAGNGTLLSVGDGTLVADGTEQQPTLFRSVEGNPGSWKGIEITADSVDSSFRNTGLFEGGASGWASVYVQNGATVSFDSCGFGRSATYGIDAEADTTLKRFENCSFSMNETRAMRVPATALGSLDTATDYSNNMAPGGVDVRNETVTQDATWVNIPGSEYDDAYHFPDGAAIESEVTINAGADLRFGEDSRFSVETGGRLRCEGEGQTGKIDFTGEEGNTPGYWHGIEIVSDTRNSLSHTRVYDAGGDGWAGVYVQNGGRVSIDDSVLYDSQTYGLHAEANTTLESFTGNSFGPVGVGAMRIPLSNLGDIDDGTNFFQSGQVDVTAETIPERATWPNLDTTVHFTESCSIDAPVTVDPGASFRFAQSTRLSVEQGGSLNAAGTPDAGISFWGEEAIPGFWEGIEIVSLDTSNVFEHCDIRYGGSGGWANIYIQDSGMATVRNSGLDDSSTYGIYVEDGGRLTESSNSFGGNASGDISQ